MVCLKLQNFIKNTFTKKREHTFPCFGDFQAGTVIEPATLFRERMIAFHHLQQGSVHYGHLRIAQHCLVIIRYWLIAFANGFAFDVVFCVMSLHMYDFEVF